ncbi:MAG: tRNA (adenosine(37)-N6)-threonylcarbamoyltransferase complex dimerization subunit type 1 TsaB [Clostridia bacterium]
MNILAVDTSALTATVSIMKDGVSVFENNITNSLTHSETLMPMIDYALKSVNLSAKDIDLYAVSQGPGSFTGIRIGVSAVKGLAYALDKPVFGMNTLLSLAYNLSIVENKPICPIMDARRSQVYNAIYTFKNGVPEEIEAPRALSIEELCQSITEPTYFVGDGCNVYKEKIIELCCENAIFAPPQLMLQKASSIAYAAHLADKKDYLSPEALEVIYLRKSQAEREREERNGEI